MRAVHFVLLTIVLLLPSSSWAVQPDEMLPNPAMEARARALSKELRCMVCQNESIDDSEAPLAHDLRVLVRERIKAGDSDQQVLDFLVARYGEFVLLKPRVSWHTAALWGLPAGVLLVGAMMIFVDLRRRKAAATAQEDVTLTAAEQARLTELMRRGT